MPEPLDLEPIKVAWKRWDAGDLPPAENYEFMRFDVPALIAEVRRLRLWIDTTGRGSVSQREVDELLGCRRPWETPA